MPCEAVRAALSRPRLVCALHARELRRSSDVEHRWEQMINIGRLWISCGRFADCRASSPTTARHKSGADLPLPGCSRTAGQRRCVRRPPLAARRGLRGRILARRSTLAGAENPLFIGLHCAGDVGLDRQFSNLVCTRRVPAEINFVWRVVVRVSADAPGDIEDLGPRAGRRAAFTPRV